MTGRGYITKIKNLRSVPGNSNLRLGTCYGFDVIVGSQIRENEVGIFFPLGTQLTREYVDENNLSFLLSNDNLIRYDIPGPDQSEGMFMSLNTLRYLGVNVHDFKEGDSFYQVNGHNICFPYYTDATKQTRSDSEFHRSVRIQIHQYPVWSAPDYRFTNPYLESNDRVYFLELLKGVTGRCGRLFIPRSETGWDKFRKLFNKDYVPPSRWQYLLGSRNYYVDKAPWSIIKEQDRVDLFQGEIIYYDIVGYNGNELIVPPRPNTSPDLVDVYGKTIEYRYKCTPENETGITNKICIHGIRYMIEGGRFVDLPWEGVKQRAGQLDMATVPEISSGVYEEGDKDTLDYTMAVLSEGPSLIDPSHPRYGVRLFVDSGRRTVSTWINKSNLSWQMDAEVLINKDIVDLEAAS